MSLRTQLLTLFAALAVVPLLAIGVIEYVRSIQALEDVVASQTEQLASQSAEAIGDRYSTTGSNLSLLAGNADVQTIYSTGGLIGEGEGEGSIRPFLRQLWKQMRRDFVRIDYVDSVNTRILTLPAVLDSTWASEDPDDRIVVVSAPVMNAAGRQIGRVDAVIRIDSLLVGASLDSRFGKSGRTALIDTIEGDVIQAGGGSGLIPGSETRKMALSRRNGGTGRFTFRIDDSTRVATVVPVPHSPFVVLSVGNADELSAPFGRIRTGNMIIVVLTTASVAVLFIILLWRATRSLSQLTLAADEVGRGNMEPSIPPAHGDEVGRLAAAFSLMVERVREALEEKERSRQLAVVGEFASQISHEIRNPLTSIKLNLQMLERGANEGAVRSDLRDPLRISLREIQRLDNVVRGVLKLGRGRNVTRMRFRLHDAASSASSAMKSTLDMQRIEVNIQDHSNGLTVMGDRALLEAAVMNILMNAAEAMPDGGAVDVIIQNDSRDGQPVTRMRVEDRGAGIQLSERDKIFTPFYSTKSHGTGLGLALAHRTVEQHKGKLWVEDRADGRNGAAFVLELPGFDAK